MPIFLAFLVSLSAQQGLRFEDEPKFSAPLALNERVVTASDFVSHLAKATGVTLTCDSRIRDDLLVLITRPRPAKEIMQTVAEHFDWQWTRVASETYKLTPSPEWVRKVRGGIAGEMQPDWRKARESALLYARELSQIDPKQLEAKAIRVGKEAGDEEGGFYQLFEKRNPFAALLAKTLATLTDAQIEGLRSRRMVLSTSPTPLESPIPPNISGQIATAVQDLSGFQQRLAAQGLIRDRVFTPSDVAEVRIEIRRYNSAEYLLLGPKHEILYKGASMLPTPARPPAPPMPAQIRAAIEVQEVTSTWQSQPAEPLTNFCDLASSVAKNLNCDLISDAYDSYVRFKNDPATWNATSSLTTSNGWLKLRSRRWLILRGQTVPRYLWATLGGRLVPELTIDERAQLAAKLREEQWRSPLIGWLSGNLAFYKFWNAVPATSRTVLRSGKSLPLGQLPQEVHEFLYQQFDADSADYFASSFFEEPEFGADPPEPEVEGAFSIDTDYAGMYPAWVSPTASLSLIGNRIPGVYMPGLRLLIAPAMLTLSAADLQQLQDDPEFKGQKLFYSETSPVRFHFAIAPGVSVNRDEVEFRPGRELTLDAETWPEDLRRRIQAAGLRRASENGVRQGTDPPALAECYQVALARRLG